MSQRGHCEGCGRNDIDVSARVALGGTKCCSRCLDRIKNGQPTRGELERPPCFRATGLCRGNPQRQEMPEPVKANAGSPEKLAALCERAQLGLALFCPQDGTAD